MPYALLLLEYFGADNSNMLGNSEEATLDKPRNYSCKGTKI